MAKRRAKYPWSDAQIRRAQAPRALPIYDDEEEKVRDDLLAEGARHLLARREGGRKPRPEQARREIRRLALEGVYAALPKLLREKPTGQTTIAKARDLLSRCGFNVSEETVLKDVKKIGTAKLRGGSDS